MESDLNRGMLKLFSTILLLSSVAFADDLDFTLIKKGDTNSTNTLLIVGGIQGDEPGGFMAASLLSTHYEITKGSVWIVPNFNFYSIIKRNRGPFGDMNRKFDKIKTNDPDYDPITRMKKIIVDENIKMVINLHDGSGFYREKYIDHLHQPEKWGQATIIDQEVIEGIPYGNLKKISDEVVAYVNQNLIKDEHIFHTKNTQTHFRTTFEEKEMAKTLTYFAIKNGKSAFGNESSKSLPVNERVYYKLLSLEKYMDIMGIEYKRKFALNPKALKNVIDNDIYISFNDKKIFIPLSRIKSELTYFPVERNTKISFKPSSPVMTVIERDGQYIVHYGNRELTTLVPQYFEYKNFPDDLKVDIDGTTQNVSLGSLVIVNNYFNVVPDENLRVNVIGYVNDKHSNESGLNIRKKYILERYSIDEDNKRYRVEVYDTHEKNTFLGMFLVEFSQNAQEPMSVALNLDEKDASNL